MVFLHLFVSPTLDMLNMSQPPTWDFDYPPIGFEALLERWFSKEDPQKYDVTWPYSMNFEIVELLNYDPTST